MSVASVIKTIEMVQGQIREVEDQLRDKKRMVNDLCRLAGRDPLYSDADTGASGVVASIRSDEFYGKPLATVVRSVLEKRGAANLGAASVAEIYDAMVQGGYEFKGKNDDNNKRGLYISLGKNTSTFHKLPNGNYGLLEWYPTAKEKKDENGNGKKAAKEDEPPLHEELKASDDGENETSETAVKAK